MLPEFIKVVSKALVILAIFVVVDILFGLLYNSFYMNQGPSRFNKMIYGNNGGNKEEIIILGDSRAEHHYNSQMIANETGKSVYNYGSDGQSVFYNYAILRKLLDSYTPERVIYEISLYELEYSDMAYDRLSYFLPMKNKYADNLIKKQSGILKLFLSKLFYSYKYNSSAFIILKSYLSPKEYFAGFQPLGNKLDESSFDEDPSAIANRRTDYVIDSMKITYFEKILQLSKEFNFDIEFFVSPTLFQTESVKLFSEINNSLTKYGYSLHNCINDSTYNVSSFADPIHLNNNGANHYTREVISKLK